MHKCGNLLMRDGLNLDKAQSILIKSFIVDITSLSCYKPPVNLSTTEIGELLQEQLDSGNVQNYHDKKFKCVACGRAFKKLSLAQKHSLEECDSLKM